MRTCSALLLSLLAASCLPPGRKLLSLELARGGEQLLVTMFDVADTSTVSEMWDRAADAPVSSQTARLEPSVGDPLTASVPGEVEIRLVWAGEPESRVTLDGVRLVRVAGGEGAWRLPPAEILRIKAAAGL
jgi:hypothetical protein